MKTVRKHLEPDRQDMLSGSGLFAKRTVSQNHKRKD